MKRFAMLIASLAFLFALNGQVLAGAVGTWTQKANGPYGYGVYGAASARTPDGKVWVFGGYGVISGSWQYSNQLWMYDPSTNTWTQKASGPAARHYSAMAALPDGRLLLYGGFGSYYYNDTWIYDPASNTWTQKANGPGYGGYYSNYYGRYGHAMAATPDGKVVMYGGYGYSNNGSSCGGGGCNDTWIYDPAANTWTQKANGPGYYGYYDYYYGRGFHAMAAASNGKIIMYGGIGATRGGGYYSNLSDTWEYDPAANTWTQKANGPSPSTGSYDNYGRYGHGMAAAPLGKVLMFGGWGYIPGSWSTGYLNDLWEYDTATNTWTQKASGPAAREYLSMAGGHPDGKVFVYGGTGNSSWPYTYNDLWEYQATPAVTTPVNVTASNLTPTSAHAAWDPSTNPPGTTYRVGLDNPSTGAWLVGPFTTTNTSYDFTGLTPGGTYRVAVRAEYGGQVSGYAVSASFTLPSVVTPTQPTLSNGGVRLNPKLTWTANGNPAGTVYELWRKTFSPDGSVATDARIYSGTDTFFQPTDQVETPQGAYFTYRARACYGGMCSGLTAETPFFIAPDASSVVTPAAGQLTVAWPHVNRQQALSYTVLWCINPTSSCGGWQSASVPVPAGQVSGSYAITGLDPSKKYYVRIADPYIGWWAGITPDDGNLSPYAFKPTAGTTSATQTSVTASWGANGNPTGVQYDVWIKPSGPMSANGTFNAAFRSQVGDPAQLIWQYAGGGWGTGVENNATRIDFRSENGNKFARFTVDGSGKYAVVYNGGFRTRLKAGKWYRVTAYARTSSATPFDLWGWAAWFGAGQNNIKIQWTGLSASTGWTPAVAVFQAPADAVVGSPHLYSHTTSVILPAGTTIDYDNIAFEEFDTQPPATPATAPDAYITTTSTTATYSGLTPGASFDVMVQARNGGDVPTGAIKMTRRTVPATPGLPEGSLGALSWSNSAGRGYVVAQWDAIPGATGYKVKLWDGQAYRVVADLPSTQTSWDSRASKVFPPESAYSGAAANSIATNPFCGGGNNPGYACVDLRDNPNALYLKTAGTSTDTATNYFIVVTSYNESGESPPSAVWQPTLPNRTDATLPQVTTVRINDDQTVTGGKQVQVYVSFTDPLVANYTPDTGDDASGVVKLELSNDNATWTAITNVSLTGGSVTVPWTLKDAFGKQYVYARVTDAAGNVSGALSDDIYYYMVDARAPSVSVTVNGGASVASSQSVSLSISAQDDLTPPGNLLMQIAGDVTNSGTWTAYATSATATLTSGDGKKSVCVNVKDASGNIGQGCAAITLQQSSGLTAPAPATGTGTTGTVTINGQQVTATFVRTPQVRLDTGGRMVEVSLDGLRWTSPGYVTDFSLPDWDGIKTVYTRYAGDSTVTKVVFVLDKTPPTVQASWLGGASAVTGSTAQVVITAQDNITPRTSLQISLNGGSTWQTMTQTIFSVNIPSLGYNVVPIIVRDQAGNEARVDLEMYRISGLPPERAVA